MTRRQRIVAYGSAAVAIVAGVICGVVIGGKTGDVVGWTLGTLGFGAIILLAFYEIGLSEDRALAKEEAERRRERSIRDFFLGPDD